jgi:hypothetical protein
VARHSLLLGLILLSGASLSSCNRSDDTDAHENDPFAARTTGAAKGDQFGKEFGKMHRADPNSEPAKVVEGTLPPVSYTAEPLPVD